VEYAVRSRLKEKLSDQSVTNWTRSPGNAAFVIDWTPACGVGSSFNPKIGLAFHFQRRGDIGFSCHCVQLVLGLNQGNIVFAFKKRKDRLDFQVVGDDFCDLQREIGLIEGEGIPSARRTRRILTTRSPFVSAS